MENIRPTRPFVSYDGADANGVRAEVLVHTGVGEIAAIRTSDTGKGKTADVHLRVPGLKHAVHGWVSRDEPIFALLEEAKERGEAIEFRIEFQRKPKIDRSVPITELRKSLDVARESVSALLVGAKPASSTSDMSLSSEAVTNPAEDATVSGGRISALDQSTRASAQGSASAPHSAAALAVDLGALRTAAESNFPQGVLDNLAAMLIAQGEDQKAVLAAMVGKTRIYSDQRPAPRDRAAREEAQWKEYNTDGRLNIGSLAVTAVVSTEQYARKILKNDENGPGITFLSDVMDERVRLVAGVILSVADRVQTEVYGGGFVADRLASSHARIRGIAYDTIENSVVLPEIVKREDADSEEVNAEIKVWRDALYAATLNRLNLALSLIEKTVTDSEERSRRPQAATRSATAVATPVEIPAFIYKPEKVADASEERATADTITLLREFFAENAGPEAEPVYLSRLLYGIFGTSKAAEVAETDLADFIDFYAGHDDDEAFDNALAWVASR